MSFVVPRIRHVAGLSATFPQHPRTLEATEPEPITRTRHPRAQGKMALRTVRQSPVVNRPAAVAGRDGVAAAAGAVVR